MARMKKETRINREKKRLVSKYADLPEETLAIVSGLIDQAAFMAIELEDMRENLATNGWIDIYQNSPNLDPVERDRPLARQYINLSKNYQVVIKQLDDKLARARNTKALTVDDGFDDFAR